MLLRTEKAQTVYEEPYPYLNRRIERINPVYRWIKSYTVKQISLFNQDLINHKAINYR